jgi:hypothetical protein
MNRKWLSVFLLWIGMAATGLAQAWQPPRAEAIAGMLPSAPPGYRVQVIPMEFGGMVMVNANYTATGSGLFPMSLSIWGQSGPFAMPPEPPDDAPQPPEATPNPPCLPDVYAQEQQGRQGFTESRSAIGDQCPNPTMVYYGVSIPFHEGDDYYYLLDASSFGPPPFDPGIFQSLDALLDQIDLPALAALGG